MSENKVKWHPYTEEIPGLDDIYLDEYQFLDGTPCGKIKE